MAYDDSKKKEGMTCFIISEGVAKKRVPSAVLARPWCQRVGKEASCPWATEGYWTLNLVKILQVPKSLTSRCIVLGLKKWVVFPNATTMTGNSAPAAFHFPARSG